MFRRPHNALNNTIPGPAFLQQTVYKHSVKADSAIYHGSLLHSVCIVVRFIGPRAPGRGKWESPVPCLHSTEPRHVQNFCSTFEGVRGEVKRAVRMASVLGCWISLKVKASSVRSKPILLYATLWFLNSGGGSVCPVCNWKLGTLLTIIYVHPLLEWYDLFLGWCW